MLVADTSVLVEHLRGEREAMDLLARWLDRGEVLVPTFGAFELWKGATTPARREKLRLLLERLLVDPFTPAMAELAGELHRIHREEGIERPVFDLLIASHAIHHDCPLATVDRDYSSIQGIDVVEL